MLPSLNPRSRCLQSHRSSPHLLHWPASPLSSLPRPVLLSSAAWPGASRVLEDTTLSSASPLGGAIMLGTARLDQICSWPANWGGVSSTCCRTAACQDFSFSNQSKTIWSSQHLWSGIYLQIDLDNNSMSRYYYHPHFTDVETESQRG